ncbi:methyltransferase-like protein 27 isoform X2 [Epinephelus moara]|uniref:methyltransferase-like protein 27 isoform X2 n=1 Tax=Epinephelus moara TaxID=300413 RepID=UPI00214EF33B|nr:methyltransferase-like protein 27 isoform X2 [Epinephelus moara]
MSDCSRTVDDVRTFLQSSKGFDPQQMMRFYDSWAETYEQDHNLMSYRAPHLAVDFLSKNFSGSPEEAQVLDVTCGSGLVAKLMVKRGFRHFVGVDGSKGMLEQAAKTGLYQDLKLALLGPEPLPAPTGGYICMSRVDPKSESGNNYKVSLEKELQLMEEEGLWTHVDTKEIDKYMMTVYNNHNNNKNEQYLDGTMYLYRKSLN